MSVGLATFDAPAGPQFSVLQVFRFPDQCDCLTWPPSLTTVAQRPNLIVERATSSYSFRFPELSQPI